MSGQGVLDETLEAFMSLGAELAARAASEFFRTVTAQPGWTKAEIEDEAEHSMVRMEIAARDAITALGGDPDGEHWRAVWTEVQRGYRERVADLLRASDSRARGTLQ